jgi:hypothetical protein
MCHTAQLIPHETLYVHTTEHISNNKRNVTECKILTSDIFSLHVLLQSSDNSDNL